MDTTPNDTPNATPNDTSAAGLATAPSGPAVALPPPTPRAAAAPRNTARTAAVIGLVVGVVAGGGAIAGLLNIARTDGSGDDPPELQITQPAPTAPAVPGAGPVAVPITLPGPAVEPAVTTAPTVTAPPITGPSDSAAPSVTTPSDSAAPSVTTGGGIQPPATSAPATTAAPSPTAGSVQMGAGVGFDVPAGWEVLSEDEAYAAIGTATAAIYVNLYSSAESASDVLFSYQSVLEGAVAGVEITDVAAAEVYSPLVVDAAAFSYRGFIGQGQSGSTAVAGTVFGDLRVDGVGIVTDVMYVPGADGTISDADRAAISAFFSSFRYGE
jgi:hypothetical protein